MREETGACDPSMLIIHSWNCHVPNLDANLVSATVFCATLMTAFTEMTFNRALTPPTHFGREDVMFPSPLPDWSAMTAIWKCQQGEAG